MLSSKRPVRVVEDGLSLQTKHGTISYSLKRSSRRRSVAVSVDETASVTVFSPLLVNQERIIRFLHEKAEWILGHVQKTSQVRQNFRKSFESGDEYFFLGRKYQIKIIECGIQRSSIEFNGMHWTINLPSGLNEQDKKRLVKTRLEDWFIKQAKEILGGRLFKESKRIGVAPKQVEVRTQKRVWGNCDIGKERIHLNWQIIQAPVEVIDYVIVHELCHLIEPNHSKRFWHQVRKFMPDFETHKKWLKDYHWEMML